MFYSLINCSCCIKEGTYFTVLEEKKQKTKDGKSCKICSDCDSCETKSR